MGGLWLGQAFGVFLLPGFGVGSSSPHVPRHPTSMCDAGVNKTKRVKAMLCEAIFLATYNTTNIVLPVAENKSTQQ